MTFSPTDEASKAVHSRWLKDGRTPNFRLFGYAPGKTRPIFRPGHVAVMCVLQPPGRQPSLRARGAKGCPAPSIR